LVLDASTPFGFGKGEGFDKGSDEPEWVVTRERTSFDEQFKKLNPVDGKITGLFQFNISHPSRLVIGRVAKEHMLKSSLPNSVLGKIWKLSDLDKDGQLDAGNFKFRP
jgi:hypothetical protein